MPQYEVTVLAEVEIRYITVDAPNESEAYAQAISQVDKCDAYDLDISGIEITKFVEAVEI